VVIVIGPTVTAMSTYMLVPGGGHGGWCYAKVKQRLEKAGHEVFAPSLTGLAEHSHLLSHAVDLDMHINDVVQLLYYWDLEEVILVGHSYGGMVITGIADRATDRIGKVVYLDAANPKGGQSLVDVAGPVIESVRPMGAIVDGVELVLLPAPGAGAFYGVTDPTDLAWMDARLTGHPWRCFEQKLELHNESELWALPQYHIVCESTVLTRDVAMIEKAQSEGRFWSINTGHDLMITEPDLVTEALLQVAAD
jgi:pimeloyl-ACP methyl ester carboxylesterase